MQTKPMTVVTVAAYPELIGGSGIPLPSDRKAPAQYVQLPPPSTDSAWCFWAPNYGKTHSNMHNKKKGRQQRRRKSGRV